MDNSRILTIYWQIGKESGVSFREALPGLLVTRSSYILAILEDYVRCGMHHSAFHMLSPSRVCFSTDADR